MSSRCLMGNKEQCFPSSIIDGGLLVIAAQVFTRSPLEPDSYSLSLLLL